jgi:ubiquinone/menaquinone biosynthesis C-methylase UbiE
MSDSDVSGRMRNDWNARAREDAGYYAGYGGRDQTDAEFFATATGVINGLETELRRVPPSQRGGWRALEIGCGPGRLMRPMSRHFSEIHGVDVSDEMVALAKQRLSDVPQAHAHLTDGATLREFPDEWFDFVYSYAVFQHIPSQEIIYGYLREILRVTKPGGLVRLQFNGLSRNGYPAGSDTWTGARFTSAELLEFTELHDFQMLALKLAGTQYMWTTWRKQPRGWQAEQRERTFPRFPSHIRRVTNSETTEPGAPSRGYFASIFLWVENLPEEAGLHQLRVAVGDSLGTVTYISAPTPDGIQQVTVILPQLEATGLLPVELR